MEEKQKKSPWYAAALIAAVISGLRFALGLLIVLAEHISWEWPSWQFQWGRGESSSLGVIGGADGPTAIFITTTVDYTGMIVAGAVFALSILACIYLRKKQK